MPSDSTSDDMESNILIMPSMSFKFSCADYGFMIVLTESSSSKSSEFLMIQYAISSAFFIGSLKFIPESNLPLAGSLCVILGIPYLFFPSLEVMPIVPTTLHLHVARSDDITRQLANCDKNYKFLYIHIVCCRNL